MVIYLKNNKLFDDQRVYLPKSSLTAAKKPGLHIQELHVGALCVLQGTCGVRTSKKLPFGENPRWGNGKSPKNWNDEWENHLPSGYD
jgi:hypothetical protein